MRNRLVVVVAGLAAAVLLFVLLRPEDEDEAAPAATTTSATTTAAATAPTTTEEEPATTPAAGEPPEPHTRTITMTIRGGRPEGGIRRVTVPRGTLVRVIVRSDVVDIVHVHGYDLARDVGPDRPALMAFRATVAGGFEIELEERGLQIAELTVRP